MSDYLKLTTDGLKLYRLIPERMEYKQRQDGSKFVVKHSKTKEIVATFDNAKDCSNWFYEESPIENIFELLREHIVIEPVVTIATLLSVIDKFPELKTLVQLLYPGDKTFPIEQPAELLMLRSSGVIDEHRYFSSFYEAGFINNTNYGLSTEIGYDPYFSVYQYGKEIGRNLRSISLYELLFGVFSVLGHVLPPENYTLKKDGLYQGVLRVADPLRRLNNICEVEEDVTLQDIFSLVKSNPELMEFLKHYSWCKPIELFHEEALKPNDDPEPNLWHLEVYRDMVLCCGEDKAELRDQTNFDCGFHGIGEISEAEKEFFQEQIDKLTKEKEETIRNQDFSKAAQLRQQIEELKTRTHANYGVSSSPTNHLAHLQIHLQEKFPIHMYSLANGIRNNFIGTGEYKTKYTLLDILDAIYWDISFYGGPEQDRETMHTLVEASFPSEP